MITHIFLGFLSNRYSFIDFFFYTWQIFQLIYGKKIFLIEMEMHSNNNLPHTCKKILEYFFGKILYLIFFMIFV